ncbi:MAG: HRDC domain-containing protein [bacterium]
MLAGSRTRMLEGSSLLELSTFGVLAPLAPDACAELLKVLVDQGLCRMAGSPYPLLEITRPGWEVMQGRTTPGFRPPPHLVPGSPLGKRVQLLRGTTASRAATAESPAIDADPEVVEALRGFRAQLARDEGVPAYVIFNDRSLFALAAHPPASETAFLAVPGLGPGKWARFGPALLEAVAGFAG